MELSADHDAIFGFEVGGLVRKLLNFSQSPGLMILTFGDFDVLIKKFGAEIVRVG